MNDALNNFNIAYKQFARHAGVFGLLIFDYLTSGLVFYLIISDLLNFQNDPIKSAVVFAISLSMSIALSAVAQAIADGVFTGRYNLRKNPIDIAIFAVGLGYIALDVYVDGMIAPFLLYGESPLQFWRYMAEGSVEFKAVVWLFRIFSLISEPGVIILLHWKLGKIKLPTKKVIRRKVTP